MKRMKHLPTLADGYRAYVVTQVYRQTAFAKNLIYDTKNGSPVSFDTPLQEDLGDILPFELGLSSSFNNSVITFIQFPRR